MRWSARAPPSPSARSSTCARGVSVMRFGRRLWLVMSSCASGSTASPPQFMPPTMPGNSRMPPGFSLGGVYMPSYSIWRKAMRHSAASMGVRPKLLASVSTSGSGPGMPAKLGMPTDCGCVGA